MRVELNDSLITLRRPVQTARGTIRERESVIVAISDAEGHIGRGEAGPLPGWSASTFSACRAELDRWVDNVHATGSLDLPPQSGAEARAAVDSALWSLRAAQSNTSLRELLGADHHDDQVAVNALLSAAAPDDLVGEARAAMTAGYDTLKVKLGVGDDHERIRALAEVARPNTKVRLDANAALAFEEAVSLCRVAADAFGGRLEYVEDPAPTLAELIRLDGSVGVPLAVDELVRTSADLEQAIGVGHVVALVAKPAFLGGITPTLALAGRAGEVGVDVVISSVYDGVIGLRAWCHLAAAVGNDRAHGLGTAGLLTDPSAQSLVAHRGRVHLR